VYVLSQEALVQQTLDSLVDSGLDQLEGGSSARSEHRAGDHESGRESHAGEGEGEGHPFSRFKIQEV